MYWNIEWSTPMLTSETNHLHYISKLASYKDRPFIVGHFEYFAGNNKAELLDLQTNSWKVKPKLPAMCIYSIQSVTMTTFLRWSKLSEKSSNAVIRYKLFLLVFFMSSDLNHSRTGPFNSAYSILSIFRLNSGNFGHFWF